MRSVSVCVVIREVISDSLLKPILLESKINDAFIFREELKDPCDGACLFKRFKIEYSLNGFACEVYNPRNHHIGKTSTAIRMVFLLRSDSELSHE